MTKNLYKCPSWIDEEAKKEWKRIIKEFEENDDLKTFDLKALEGYCQSYSRWKQCENVLQTAGLTFTTPNGYVQQRPEVAISNKALAEMRAWTKELGLTPAARARMKKNNDTGETVDPEEKEMEDMIAK